MPGIGGTTSWFERGPSLPIPARDAGGGVPRTGGQTNRDGSVEPFLDAGDDRLGGLADDLGRSAGGLGGDHLAACLGGPSEVLVLLGLHGLDGFGEGVADVAFGEGLDERGEAAPVGVVLGLR